MKAKSNGFTAARSAFADLANPLISKPIIKSRARSTDVANVPDASNLKPLFPNNEPKAAKSGDVKSISKAIFFRNEKSITKFKLRLNPSKSNENQGKAGTVGIRP